MRKGYKAVGIEWLWVGRGREREVKRRMAINTPKTHTHCPSHTIR